MLCLLIDGQKNYWVFMVYLILKKGDILFPIDAKYDGSLYVYGCKFMHIVSVLGFYPYAKIYCYDESSYRYISKIALEKDLEREIIKKY